MQASEGFYRHVPFGAAALSWVVMGGIIVVYAVTDRPMTWDAVSCGVVLFVAVNAMWVSTSCCLRCRDRIIAEACRNRRVNTANTNRVLLRQPDPRLIAAWAIKEVEGDGPPPGVVNLDRRR